MIYIAPENGILCFILYLAIFLLLIAFQLIILSSLRFKMVDWLFFFTYKSA